MSDLFIKIDELIRLSKGKISTVKGLLKAAVKRSSVLHCTKDHRYNGWTNYETWNVALWIDNEEGDYRYWNEQAQECYDEAKPDTCGGDKWSREENAAWALAKRLKAHYEDAAADQSVCGTFADLLNGALSEVNWNEIATSRMENVEKEEVTP